MSCVQHSCVSDQMFLLLDGSTVRLPTLIGLSRAMDLILNGREVSVLEAECIGECLNQYQIESQHICGCECTFQTGLADRVVPNGQSLEAAIQLAKEIATLPQQCMRVDRLSALHSTYSRNSHLEALRFEFEQGIRVVKQKSRSLVPSGLWVVLAEVESLNEPGSDQNLQVVCM